MESLPGTALVRRLGIGPGAVAAFLDAPAGFDATLGPLPAGVEKHDSPAAGGPFDIVLCFTTRRAALERRIAEARRVMAPHCGLWIAWPKKASKVPTEVTDDTIRDVALPTGLVDNKVCAIDATWSALRLVIRRELR